MTESSRMTVARQVERGIRCGILVVAVVGLRRRNWSTVANAVVALAGTFLPTAAERGYDVELRAWQRVYTEVAMFNHAVGMLGPYDDTWWWDHLTHAHSATIVGGFVHAAARRRGRDPRPRVVAAVVGCGALWEVMEYVVHTVADRLGIEPMLVFYGETDTLLDLCFNLVGVAAVLVFGDRLLDNLTGRAE